MQDIKEYSVISPVFYHREFKVISAMTIYKAQVHGAITEGNEDIFEAWCKEHINVVVTGDE